MPGTVFTVASGKGGVGKTTTTVNLAVAIWQEGNSVAVVDADLGMANLAAVLGLEPETTLHDVLAGETILEEALVEAKGGDLLVLPGSRDLEGFAAANPQKLTEVLENLRARCDYVIVDTGAGLGYEDVLPLGLADAVILVSSADPASLGDTRKTAELAALVETPVLGLVVTRAVEATDAEAIAAEIGADLLGTIPEDPAVMESTVAGDPLASHAPDADATAAYMALGRAVLEADLPEPPASAGDAAAGLPGSAPEVEDSAVEAESAGPEAADSGVADEADPGEPDEPAAATEDAAAAEADTDEPVGAEHEHADDAADEADAEADAGADAEAEVDEEAADVEAEAEDEDEAAAEPTDPDESEGDATEDEASSEDAGGFRAWLGRRFS